MRFLKTDILIQRIINMRTILKRTTNAKSIDVFLLKLERIGCLYKTSKLLCFFIIIYLHILMGRKQINQSKA